MGRRSELALVGATVSVLAGPAWAGDLDAPMATRVEESPAVSALTVTGRRLNLVGEAISASEGRVGQDDLAARPMLRTGDLLEFVPGLIATQHSGSGKANQYFLRGFNLDHGTDFATSVDAMPVNMRTHGHGQGYTDLNFLIPETVNELAYRKGVYYADVGDFSGAGSARFSIADKLARRLEVTAGDYGYYRGVIVGSTSVGAEGELMYGLEAQSLDGPWTDIDENMRKANAVVRYSTTVGAGRGHVMLMAYGNGWNSPDQIPQRAVDQRLIGPFGSLDPTVGGKASRYSLSAGWAGSVAGGELTSQVYAIASRLRLFSNFTYLLDNPVNGDQFEQVDDRKVYGFEVSQHWERGRSRWRVGLDGRYDDIDQVGLFHTQARVRLGAVRDDTVEEGSLGIFGTHEYRFNDHLRSYIGLRHDRYAFDVASRTVAANSGEADDSATSLKASLVYKPSDPLELYASYGQGFHSNDARGTTIAIDPLTGDPAEPVTPLVRSTGGEVGARVHLNDRLQATLALWTLRLDSELLFVGDAGNTEASRPSRRQGVEFGVYYFPSPNISADLELSLSDAQFRDDDPAGDDVPGSIPLVASAGVSGKSDTGWVASVRARYFGPYPLMEDGSVKSDGSTLVNLRLGREGQRLGLYLDVLNLLDSADHDVDYLYASRLPGEPPEGVEDTHFHIFQPRSVRMSLNYRF